MYEARLSEIGTNLLDFGISLEDLGISGKACWVCQIVKTDRL